ncbi:crotonase/enoyl-CoA hydratase family protein [Defluviimonas sp. WL0024]|uniref:Crotonase/enoyl-CoA hydratase family protein n=1 Tax=Albidovulum salinarum TaxID=2984153 RepID=A0ABT2X0N2_9RHOB|nr:crotonase/enoyl-CoA hydratase family protein [Defluviimonas sp. WL0024]MCU9847487.1 crotonase/enoyl-CoA hydratase family protein [Defluviimonas sp. WL0024]
MGDVVRVTLGEDGVAEVCLNRPERKNAWTMEMFDALAGAADGLSREKGLRAVILRGAGGCFSSGLDLSVLQGFAADIEGLKREILTPPEGEAANRFQKPCTAWAALPVPVIAAVEGVAYGAGLQLALAADFRIAAPDARLSVMEAKWGLIPDMGISQFLPRLMRADQAKDLIMSARVVGAEEALALGLVTRLAADPVAAAREMAAELALRSPDALTAAKRLVEAGWVLPLGEGLALEARLQADILGGANQIEAVMAAMAGRAPRYR